MQKISGKSAYSQAAHQWFQGPGYVYLFYAVRTERHIQSFFPRGFN